MNTPRYQLRNTNKKKYCWIYRKVKGYSNISAGMYEEDYDMNRNLEIKFGKIQCHGEGCSMMISPMVFRKHILDICKASKKCDQGFNGWCGRISLHEKEERAKSMKEYEDSLLCVSCQFCDGNITAQEDKMKEVMMKHIEKNHSEKYIKMLMEMDNEGDFA
jgi:hypothetical protein